MLVLTRKPRQQIMIGDSIVVNVVEVQGDNVRIAIEAPRDIKIYRGEIYRAIQEENRKAAMPADFDLSKLPKPQQ
ncbi:carbon storage regulator CsrA [Schwartzia sp. (in: firmicutes)]|nr:carbon storage regulator CsrA [Schwartzia sp. (in: firmicutes)]